MKAMKDLSAFESLFQQCLGLVSLIVASGHKDWLPEVNPSTKFTKSVQEEGRVQSHSRLSKCQTKETANSIVRRYIGKELKEGLTVYRQ
jgi:hypothetical protein